MGTESQPRIELRVLGPVEALRDGLALPVGGPRQRALLALLALEPGRPVAHGRLVDELWAGEPPEGAEITLRSYVSRLRATLGPEAPITSASASYTLEVDAQTIDARRFERMVRDAETALARRNPRGARDLATAGLALWRGSAYGDHGSDGALRIDADRLQALRLRATELRLEASLALGENAELVDELEALVREHPYMERFWQQLMLALYRADRQADALAAYHRARLALDEQLGIEPGAALQELEAAILRHDVPPAEPPPDRNTLPAPISTFIGRGDELAAVGRLVRDHRLVTLTGIGGVGKTRLGIEAARAVAEESRDGAWFVDLAPLADPAMVATHVASAIGLREAAGTEPIERLAAHVRDQAGLLLLDNCEHLHAEVARLAHRLLASSPALRILATSREVLGVPGEAEYQVPPLSLPASTDSSDAIRDSEAVRLFVARAREARPGLADDDATLATIARICAELEGLPLALELAAARARVLSATEIGSRLHDRFRFLVSWSRLATARHRTLLEAMDWSYGLLDPDAQRLLAEVSVFAGGFTLEAVASVATGPAAEHALELIERLVEASLVNVDQSADPTRYRLLETVRQYGAGHLESSGMTGELRDRHARYFARLAAAARDPIRSAGVQTEWMARLDQDRDNVRAALTSSLERGAGERALQIAEAVWYYFWVRGQSREGRAWLERSLEDAAAADPTLRATALLGLGGLAWALGDFDVAEPAAAEAARLLDELGDALQAGKAQNTLGLLAAGRGDPGRARGLYLAALERYGTVDADLQSLRRSTAIVVDNLGTAHYDLHEFDEARRRYEEARSINLELGDPEGVAMNDLHLALVDIEARDWSDARDRIASALDLYRRVEFLHYASECLEVAATVANGLGEPREAAFALGAATQLRARVGNPPVPLAERMRRQAEAVSRAALSDRAFDEAEAEGREATVDAAIDRVLRFLGPVEPSEPRGGADPG